MVKRKKRRRGKKKHTNGEGVDPTRSRFKKGIRRLLEDEVAVEYEFGKLSVPQKYRRLRHRQPGGLGFAPMKRIPD